MAPLFLLTMLCLTPFLVAAHTENFNFVQNLARQAGVNLDLTGKQSYAIYETIPDTATNGPVRPSLTRMKKYSILLQHGAGNLSIKDMIPF
ncbi:hypothetical protein MGG_16789 [Pyricularia oryzae 70-15]|uniref:Uncharacterized protein n=3 Tax=Pyricularia oryzae TaxID=318829 RepID=G4N0X2_PYRO7|nr:uncharacterized protein MGG_16789 [Pyricularia oryzae 70-15]ELQ40045.1 hypothetical protein OOU_Y34scaffold00463g5 [Pyricularia oryzae Y34]KAI6253048.1 hypothetical protein MCOR19_010368 [Pyricularia oryzae]EHA52350.1 hypothetical protein MGG_16789 [Pyricularia oryzae 70-15]KAI6271843.1 hypothetical protein MCOR26_007622 [Pyricularia oryzae]KAI6306740.1 hypothetical protein MCOR29_010010 [Pyricularia oryzae]